MTFLAVYYRNHSNKKLSCKLKRLSSIVALSLGCFSASGAYAYASDSGSNKSDADAAFQQLMQNSFPLTPDQIHKYKTATVNYEKAKQMPAGDAPLEGVSHMFNVNLKPGSSMTLINMAYNNITALKFIDANGVSWPIAKVSVGNESAFSVTNGGSAGILIGSAKKRFATTSMFIMFKGLQVPVMFKLVVGGNNKTYDSLDYLKIPLSMPGSKGSGGLLTESPSYLNGVLQDIAPKGSHLLQTNSQMVKVWRYGNKYLLTTRATLLSPAFKATTSSPVLFGSNKYHAYEIKPTPIIILSQNGTQVTVNVTDNTRASMSGDSNSFNNVIGGGNIS